MVLHGSVMNTEVFVSDLSVPPTTSHLWKMFIPLLQDQDQEGWLLIHSA